MIIQTVYNTNNHFRIPKNLRNKTVNSRISREIYFIDCLNDLIYCANSEISYHLIRASVLLRILILDGGMKAINENYGVNILFEAIDKEIDGTPLSNNKIREIKKTLCEYRYGTGSYTALKLKASPLKKYTLESFNDKICLKMKGDEELSFSVRNIINLIANKNGGAHLESSFDSSDEEAFHLDEFNPFSITDGNFYLDKIKEIIYILIDAVSPLATIVIRNLHLYNRSFTQVRVTNTAIAINTKDLKNLKS